MDSEGCLGLSSYSRHNYGVNTEDLIDGGERIDVELKRKLTGKDLYRTVVCMANGQGGTIVVGADEGGGLHDASMIDGRAVEPFRLAASIQNNTQPPHPVKTRLEEVRGTVVIVISVPQSTSGPIGTMSGQYVKRVLGPDGKPACLPMTPHDLLSRSYIAHGKDYALALAAGAAFEDLDRGEFDRFRRWCRVGRADHELADASDVEICQALNLIPSEGGISLGMILLFGTAQALNKWVPTAEVLFQDSRSAVTQVNEELRFPLVRMMEELTARLEIRNSTQELYVGMLRVDIPLLTEATRRESIANALIHRDYGSLGPITVQLDDAEFRVSSPGGFLPGVTAETVLDQSRPRSVALAHAFKRAGLVERRGKGVNDMFESQLRAGKDAPDFSRSTTDSVQLSVSLGGTDATLLTFLTRRQNEDQRTLTLSELRVLYEIRASGSATVAEMVDALSMTPAAARVTATNLVEAGVVEARGNGRARRFHLTARFYELAEDRAAYLRVRPVDRLQQLRMIDDYAREFGSITRAQAADLCQVQPQAARQLLRELVDQGSLVLRGERRGSHYIKPERAE